MTADRDPGAAAAPDLPRTETGRWLAEVCRSLGWRSKGADSPDARIAAVEAESLPTAAVLGEAIGRYIHLPRVFESYTQLGQYVLDTLTGSEHRD